MAKVVTGLETLVKELEWRQQKFSDKAANKMLANAAEDTLKPAIQKAIKKAGLVDKGDLLNSIQVEETSTGARVFTDAIHARVHEYGAVITPRSGRFLVFTVGASFVKTTVSRIPARPFFKPGINQGRRAFVDKVKRLAAKAIE